MTYEEMTRILNLLDEVWDKVASRQRWKESSDPYEHIYVDIEPIDYDGDQIDSVLVFAEGTIEFHLKNEEDALNWTYFPEDICKEVIKRMCQ